MRSFRVFNDIRDVRIVWKLAGVRLGPYGQIAILALMTLCLGLLTFAGPIVSAVVFIVGFVLVATYASVLSRLDETGKLSERTQLRLLRRGLQHRHSANFDLPGL